MGYIMAFEDESILHNSSTGGVSYASTAPTIETDDGTVTVSKTTLNNIIKTLDEQIKYLKENKVSFIQAINLYKILIFSNKTPFSGGNLSKVYNYIKSLKSNEIQKIQL